MSLIEEFKPLSNIPDLNDKTINQNPTVEPQSAPLVATTSKLSEFSYQGLLTKNLLNKAFDFSPLNLRPTDDPPLAPPPLPPYQAVSQIEKLPKPNYDGLPTGLPDDDRRAAYEGRVRQYNEQRIAIADYSLLTAKPPSRSDYSSLPHGIAEAEYRDALRSYSQYISELRTISREAKVQNLELNAEFRKLTPENKALLKSKMEANQLDPRAVSILARLGGSPGFNQLGAKDQTRLINLVGGTNERLSVPARNALAAILNDPKTDLTNPETFKKFLREQPGLNLVVSQSVKPGEFDSKRRAYDITGPTDVSNYSFHSGPADALKYEVEIDGRKIPVYLPKNPDSSQNYHSIDEIAKGLAALPQPSLDRVDNVLVEPKQNPDDAYWAKKYNSPDFRSYMTAGASGDVNVYPTPAFNSSGAALSRPSQSALDGSFIHETGHILSGQEFDAKDWKKWEAAMRNDGISPSTYARSDRQEDFSETLELYMIVKGTPQEAEIRAIMPERFAILDKLVGK